MKGYDPTSLGISQFKLAGVEAKMRCPFHLDHTPSARFNLKSGLFHCFGCGTSANVHQLAKMLGGFVSMIDIDKIIVDDDPKEWMPLLYSKPAYRSEYLKSRGVANEQVEKFGIMKTPDGILFPIRNKVGTPIGIQMRRFDNSPRYIIYGEKTPVWPMMNLKYEYLCLVEGVFGVLRGDGFGFKVVCTMGAAAIPPAAIALKGRKVRIIFDDDIAGYLGAYSFMKLHSRSEMAAPGAETDELDFPGWAFNASFLGTRNVVEYATKHKMKELLDMIKLKEEKDAKSKLHTKGTTARKVGNHRKFR